MVVEPSTSGVSAAGPATRRVGRWRVATAYSLVIGSIVACAGGWVAFFSDPDIDGLVGADVAEVTVPGSDIVTLETGTYTVYHDPDRCETGTEGCGVLQATVEPANGEEPPVALHRTR